MSKDADLEELESREFGKALVTVAVAAVFLAAENSATDQDQELCFSRAERFVAEAVQRYGKQLGFS